MKLLSALVLAVALSTASTLPAMAQPAAAPATDILPTPASLARRGVQRFLFDGWAGPSFPVWYIRPAGVAADAPILFVVHGRSRDADRYIADWVDLANENGFVVVVPEFTNEAFPRTTFNHGGFADDEGRPLPRERWSYSTIEPIFDAIVGREGLTTGRYVLFGHSAGAQFVHRFVLTGGGSRLDRAFSANAGSYAMTTEQVAWPFGVGGIPMDGWNAEQAYAQPMVVLLGTADNDPDYPSLPREPQAMAQGAHRLERGQRFYRIARADSAARHASFNWQCGLVPGVGHDNSGMAPYAMALITGRLQLANGADCRQLSLDEASRPN
jgi:poly(3-hydroxybutyrate) depolymerase